MRIKVRDAFRLLSRLEGERRQQIEDQVWGRDRKPKGSYGRNFGVALTFRRLLENCEFEIEIPSSDEQILVSLAQDELLNELLAEIGQR